MATCALGCLLSRLPPSGFKVSVALVVPLFLHHFFHYIKCDPRKLPESQRVVCLVDFFDGDLYFEFVPLQLIHWLTRREGQRSESQFHKSDHPVIFPRSLCDVFLHVFTTFGSALVDKSNDKSKETSSKCFRGRLYAKLAEAERLRAMTAMV